MVVLECEICGAAGASKKARVGQSELVVCENCASLGDETGDYSKNKDVTKVKKTSVPKKKTYDFRREEVLKRDYGKTVRKARENMDLTMEDLAQKIGEKKSVIRRVENEKLKPDKKLSGKLKKELKVELFTEVDENHATKKGSEDKMTIGDVAEVK